MHAHAISQRKIFHSVHEAFWKQEPRAAGVLASLGCPRVVIVPFFLSEGYFTEVVIPRELSLTPHPTFAGLRLRATPHQTICYTPTVGCDDRIASAVLGRAEAAIAEAAACATGAQAPHPSQFSLFLAGHGTPRNTSSRQSVELHAAAIRTLRKYAAVQTVFLEEEPGIARVYELAPTRHIMVVPFFTSDGLHTRQDIPALLGEDREAIARRIACGEPTWRNPTERHGKIIWCAKAIGTDPSLAEIVVERAALAVSQLWMNEGASG